MVDVTITPANVKKGADATVENGIAGAAVLAGQLVYKGVGGKYFLADSDSITTGANQMRGFALHSAGIDQPLAVQTNGDITVGGTLVAGATYFLSNTPGGLCPDADVGAGEKVNLVGTARSTTVLTIDPSFPGVTR